MNPAAAHGKAVAELETLSLEELKTLELAEGVNPTIRKVINELVVARIAAKKKRQP